MKLELCGMGVIKQRFREKVLYFCTNNYLFVEIKGANFRDNYGTHRYSPLKTGGSCHALILTF